MKKFFYTIIIVLFSVNMGAQEYQLRGKIVSIQPETKDTLALPEATLILFDKIDGKWISLASSMSNSEGIYFFEKVKPGTYFVQVNKKKNFKIKVEEKDTKQVQDLPLIVY